MTQPDWRWFLARPVKNVDGSFREFSNIGQLDTAQDRKLTLALNAPESAGFSVNTLDDIAPEIKTVETCVVCYRNDVLKWSGPVWTIDETVADKSETVTVGCIGWFQFLLERILKTGEVGYAAFPPTKGVGPEKTSTAFEQFYNETDPGLIAKDFLVRTNYEYPTMILPGTITPAPEGLKWNVKYSQFQNIGLAIQTLSNTEHGFDFRVDPATLLFNVYYSLVKPGTTIWGRGMDKPNAVFGYNWGAKNLASLQRQTDGSKLKNEETVIGKLGTALASSPESIERYGLFQGNASLSDHDSPEIMQAYAGAEILVRERPQVIYNFTPNVTTDEENVPQPFDDYDIGDFVYVGADYGRMKVFDASGEHAQPTRCFSFELDIDQNGNEQVKNVQTVFTAAA